MVADFLFVWSLIVKPLSPPVHLTLSKQRPKSLPIFAGYFSDPARMNPCVQLRSIFRMPMLTTI